MSFEFPLWVNSSLCARSTPLQYLASVFKQKVYAPVDVVYGYKFVNALYRGRRRGDLKVDMSLINDVQVIEGNDMDYLKNRLSALE